MADSRTRKGVLFFALILGGAAAVIWTGQGQRRSSGRAFAFRYAASFANIPPNAHHVRIWIPLARTRANQEVLSRQIHSSLPYEIHEEPVFGNDLLYLAARPPVAQPLEVAIDYEVVVSRALRWEPREWVGHTTSIASADELVVSLRDEPLMVVNETVAQLAKDATTGQTKELEKARAIYDYVIGHMRYDKTTPGWGRGDTLRACRLGAGNCTDFHSLFISMSRASGIPARFVIGAAIPQEPSGTIPGYHCWAEFYRPGHGWVPVDASEAWQHPKRREAYFGSWDANKFSISVGRNLTLAPAQEGPPVNYLVYPYVEVDGKPFEGVTTQFGFTNRNTQEG
ncbi:MAG: transglutaminase domain-containing protein [Candidatus Omnitrophica bacterium]|nr:transglutaminase domain-containing protein [Candidatus Omnitrophota bacterium]